jgi:outer membrane protease
MRAGWGYCEASSVLFRIVPRAIDVTAAGGAGVGAGGAKVQEQAWARVAERPRWTRRAKHHRAQTAYG